MNLSKLLIAVQSAVVLVSCETSAVVYLENYSPEESGLAMMKITDENQSIIAGLGLGTYTSATHHNGICANDFLS